MLSKSLHVQIAVREISAAEALAGAPADPSNFTFEVHRVVKRLAPDKGADPDIRLAKALLARSRHNGPQEELWIANSIARLKMQGHMAPLEQGSGKLKGAQRFKEVATHVGHIAQAVAQLNKLKLRLNDEVRGMHTLCFHPLCTFSCARAGCMNLSINALSQR